MLSRSRIAVLPTCACILLAGLSSAKGQTAENESELPPRNDPVVTELRSCNNEKERLAGVIADLNAKQDETVTSCNANDIRQDRQIADQLERIEALKTQQEASDALKTRIEKLELQLSDTAEQADSLTNELQKTKAELAQARARIAQLGATLQPAFSYFKGSPYASSVTSREIERRFPEVTIIAVEKCGEALAWLEEQKGGQRAVDLSVWAKTEDEQLRVCRRDLSGKRSDDVPGASTEAHLLLFK